MAQIIKKIFLITLSIILGGSTYAPTEKLNSDNNLTTVSFQGKIVLEDPEELVYDNAGDNYVGSIKSIKVLNDKVYISDASTIKIHSLKIQSDNQSTNRKKLEFEKSVGRFGHGPNEFPKAPYLYKGENELFVNEQLSNTFYLYDTELNIKDKICLPDQFIYNDFDPVILKDRFIIPGNNKLLRDLRTGIEDYYTLLITDRNGNHQKSFGQLSEQYEEKADQLFYARNNFSKVTKGFGNTIISIQMATNNFDVYDYNGKLKATYSYRPKNYLTPPDIKSNYKFNSIEDAMKKYYSKTTYINKIIYDEKNDLVFVHYRSLHADQQKSKSFLDADNYLLVINNKWECVFDEEINGYLADIEDGKIYLVSEESVDKIVLKKYEINKNDKISL